MGKGATFVSTGKGSPQPFFYEGDRRGLLLIHGFTGTTAELQPMGRFFHEKGYTVHAPLLAGHGTSPEEMAMTGWPDWWSSTVEGYKKLVQYGCQPIYVAGLSMGGLLALKLAHNYEVKAIISMCTPIYVKDRRIYLTPLLKRVVTYSPRTEEKEFHIEQSIFPYDRTPVCCIANLYDLIRRVKKRLPDITKPIFIAQGHRDETVKPKSAQYIYEHIGSDVKKLVWYEKSSHIITLDHEREALFRDIESFIHSLDP